MNMITARKVKHFIKILLYEITFNLKNIIYQADKNYFKRSELIYPDAKFLSVNRNAIHTSIGYFELISKKRVAYDSPDHIMPWGTSRDNSRNDDFTLKIIRLLDNQKLSLLDLGCSGGGQVRSFIEYGYPAIGIEGSDYSEKLNRAEWANIPHFLFTSDITSDFSVVTRKEKEQDSNLYKFLVVTMWEVIEHIPEEKLPNVFDNVKKHLKDEGVFILSVSPISDIVNGIELHQTIKPKYWWDSLIEAHGFTNNEWILSYLGKDLVRLDDKTIGNRHASQSFHYALTLKGHQLGLSSRGLSLKESISKTNN